MMDHTIQTNTTILCWQLHPLYIYLPAKHFILKVGMYLAKYMKASLVLYITDMPTTAAWLTHVYGTYSGEGELFRDADVGAAVLEVVSKHLPGEPELLK